MDTTLQDLESRLTAALAEQPSRVPVLVGPSGSGRTEALRRLAARLGPGASQYVDLERVTSTPERCLSALTDESPFRWQPRAGAAAGPHDAYARTLAYWNEARKSGGGPATFLLDEILELRTFESFPGLRRAVPDTLSAIAASGNHFVLATKFVTRALRAFGPAPDRFQIVHVPPVSVAAVAADLLEVDGMRSDGAEDSARLIVQLADGQAAYCDALVRALRRSGTRIPDPVSALAALLTPGGELDTRCRYTYEIRLHRARGYGALKGVLGILAEEEPLTLTEIALQLGRTPGSTKDYLGWLEDVDLVRVQRKRYSFGDPLLRLWVRLHAGCDVPSEDRVSEDVQRYTLARLSTSPPLDAATAG
ncbi:MAG: hypothetical protein NTY02_16790 [Acidobacteria bacterium]|nr:hypothetical protein [Acidobacteriota bacterium]